MNKTPSKTAAAKSPRTSEFPADIVRQYSLAVYLDRLGDDAEAMIAEVGMAKVRERAGSYDALTRAYMRAMKIQVEP